MVQMVRNLPATTGDPGSIPGVRRSPRKDGYLPYSCLENYGQRPGGLQFMGLPKGSQTQLVTNTAT